MTHLECRSNLRLRHSRLNTKPLAILSPPPPHNLCLSHTPHVGIRSRSCQLPPPAVHDKDPAITINASFPRFVPRNVSSDSVGSTSRICAAHFCPPPPLPPWTNPPTSLFCSSTHPVQVRRTCASYAPVIHLKSHPGAAPPRNMNNSPKGRTQEPYYNFLRENIPTEQTFLIKIESLLYTGPSFNGLRTIH